MWTSISANLGTSQDEWVVCRVFQKNAINKKPYFTPFHPSLESDCDDTTLEGFELSHPSSVANSSSCFSSVSTNNSNNGNIVNLNMNWTSAKEATNHPSLSCSPSLLGPDLSMNSMILTALQLGGYQPREAAMTDLSSFPTQGNSRFITDLNSNFPASSIDSVQQRQFNVDSIW
uniref:NAC domain-containing protein n=1 Tax=Nelumbo nucifera TaxID=4432 RepID=A0A822YJT3_NELNU|nr:TPA_asm: hypothetical protein HUJ06_010642 [Nelumbo nucifera]